MQEYIIKSFKRTSDDALFIRQETGTNSGGYVHTNARTNAPEVKRLNDFLCDSGFIIYAVTRQNQFGGEVFTIGDRLASNEGTNIRAIRIAMSDVILYLSGGTLPNPSIRLVNAVKYVEPVLQPAPTRNPVGRPRKVTTSATFFETLEAAILAANPDELRLEATLLKSIRKLTLRDFLIRFFKEFNNERATIFVESHATQTEVGKRRSLGDIYRICKYYFPEITLKELMQLLYIDLMAVEGFRSSKCGQIRKRVWYYSNGSSNGLLNTGDTDEYGNTSEVVINNLNS
jgi:hypothetical protein